MQEDVFRQPRTVEERERGQNKGSDVSINHDAHEGAPIFWAAPELIDAGYKVFPVDSKAPTVEGGFYAGSVDKSQVAAWIEDGREDHDIGVATGVFGGFVAIDADTPEAFEKMKAEFGPPAYTTRRGGHWLFGHPQNGKVSCTNKFAPGLDRKGDLGYVIFPPSKGRKWTNGIPRPGDLPKLPRRFWSKSKGPTPGERKIPQDRKVAAAAIVAEHVRGITPETPGAGRHDHLRHLCGVLLGREVSLVDAEDILKAAWGKVGGDLAERAAGGEITNTLATTQAAMIGDRATGVPSMEGITPGLFNELAEALGWIRTIRHGGKGEQNEEPQEHPFPVMDDAAYRGIFGEIVQTIEPHTEADPVAILLSAISFFGSSYGRRGYVEISGTRHHGNLFVGIVGDTARARKGTSLSPVKNIFGTADPEWAQNKIVGGLSSGEGLINVVRDAVEGQNKDGDIVEVDKGVPDKRLLVAEGELSQGLKVLRREGNTLSPILRNAWDGGDLATLTRNSPLRATEPHISILGHITATELLKHLVEGEAANGFGNRFLWACVRRSKKLPFGGELSSVDMSPIIRGLRSALDHGAGRMSFAENARDPWVEMYDSLTEDRPGMFGMITARAEAQTLRLAILYALAAGSHEIGVEHLASAYAVWGYCEDSALHLFGDQLGDADADKLVDALRSTPEGMTRTEIRDLFGRNKKPEDLQRILNLLEHAGKAYSERAAGESGGRPTETWFAA